MKRLKYILSLLLISISFSIFSQTDTEFWFVAPEVTAGHGDSPISFRFSSFGAASQVTLYQPANTLFAPIVVNIPADGLVTVNVTAWKDTYVENKPWDQVNNLGFHILATSPITAYYEVERSNNPDIFTLKGRNALGKNFMIPSQNYIDNKNALTPDARSSFEIVATEDNTTITITPSKTIEVGHSTPYTIVLDRGETYSATAASRLAADHLFGTKVVSDKPIAITIKDDSVYGNPCYDLLGDQIVPIELIGTDYIAIKGGLTAQEGICVVAVSNNTDVYVDGVLKTTLSEGQNYKFTIAGASGTNCYIETSLPSYVLQITGFGCETGMALLPPAKCTGSSKVAFARTTAEYFGMILFTESGSEDDFTVISNGITAKIPASSFTAVAASSGFVSGLIDNADYKIAEWNFPNNPDNQYADAGISTNYDAITETNSKQISTVGGTSAINYANAGATTQSAYATTWNAGNGTKYWQIELNTLGIATMTVSSKQYSSTDGPRNFQIQYKVGAGAWTNLTVVPAISNNWTSGVVTNFALPVACENKASVFLRWIMNSNTSVSGGVIAAAGYSMIDDILIKGDMIAINNQTTVTNSTAKFHCGVINGGASTGCRYGYFSNYNTLDIGENDFLFNGCGYDLDAGAEWTTFLWNTGETTQQITAQDSGWYWVDASKATCSLRDSIYITYIPPITLGNDTSICYGDSVVLDIGAGYAHYKWSTGAENDSINSITVSGGTYSVTVTDFFGCTSTATIKILVGTQMAVDISKTDVICFGESNGQVNLTASGGFTPYTFNWNSGQTTEDLTNIPQGNYFVTVTDIIGCQIDTNIALTSPLAPISVTSVVNDVSCFEGNNGAIDITVSGDIPPYSFIWDNGSTNEDISGLLAGFYNLTITGANLCSHVFSDTVLRPSNVLSAFILGNSAKCKGSADGSTSTTISGGTSPYSYLWSNTQTTLDISGVSTGNYSLVVTDANLCTTTASVNIGEPSASISISATATEPLCNGSYDGTINLTVTGGTPDYNYIWNTSQISEDLLGVSAGTYFVTVTDVNNCSDSTSIVVGEPDAINISSVVSDVDCFGDSNGSVDVTISGGTSAYSYFWSNNSTLEDLSNVQSNSYNLTVTDSQFCTETASILVNTPNELSSQIYATNVSCKGGNDGAVNLTPVGGTAPFSFLWNTGATSEDLSNLLIGTFSVTITDANGCTTSNSVTVTEPANNLTVSIVGTNLDCNGIATGKTQLTVSGGTPNYSYLWSNGYTNSDLTNLLAGNYSVTVTDSKSCTANANVTLTQPTAISEVVSINNSTCGQSDGSVSVNVGGGTAGYSYLWSNGITINSLSNVKAGAYSLTITDAKSCTKVVNTNVNDVSSPTITTNSVSDVTCYGSANGSIFITASGGTSPYSYQWSNGGTSNIISSISGGTYTIKVIDNAGCISSKSIDVNEPDEINSILIKQNVNCNGGNDGSINLIVSGGTSPYTFSWNNGALTEDLSNIVAGSYIVTITDNKGCSVTDNVSVTQPANALTVSANITAVVCNGEENGKIDLSVNFGTPSYGYQWSSGQQSQDIDNLKAGTYDVTVTDANNCTASHSYTVSEPQVLSASIVGTDVLCNGVPTGTATLTVIGGNIGAKNYVWNYGQVTQNLTNIGAGNYQVTVTDSKSCRTTASVIISQPSALSATITKTNIKCNGQTNGTANLEVSGGVPPYTYLWTGGATTQDLSNIGAGTYFVTVKDANNCSINSSVSISSPTVISVSGASNAVGCSGGNDGEALLTVSGGTSPYTYQWNLGQTSEDLTNLQAGIYLVTIYDSKLCSKTHSVTVSEPLPISLSAVISDVTCLNGTNGAINLSVSGGTGAYSYNWNNGFTTQDLSGLDDGIYEVTVSDANLCSSSSAYTVAQPSTAITIGLDVSNLKCRIGADGEIDATASGGTPPYTYLWSNGFPTQDLTGLSIGTYTLTITDANNCTNSSSATLTQPNTLLSLATAKTDILCNEASTGEINLTVTDGIAPYSYLWSNGTLSEDVTNLPAGNYTVSVTDANFCVKNTTISLSEPSAVSITDVSTNATCLTPNGSSTLTVTGGVAPYTYLWSTGSTTNSITNVTSGAYSVTVTDNHACETDYSADVNDATGPNVQISYKSDVTCNGDADGKATVYVISGLAPYTYLWSGGSTTTIQSNLSGGYQTVRVTDVNGCVASRSVYIDEPEQLIVTNYTPNICDVAELGFIDLTVTGGIQNYRYAWSNGSTSQDLIDIPAGNYVVTVTDVNACQEIQSIDLNAPAISLSSSILGTNVKCKNGSDGIANLSVVGGTTPYSYLWNFGQITQDLNNIPAGFYEVTVSDAISCKSISSITITEPTIINKSTVRTNVTCNGLANGSINLTTSGGTAPRTFLWSNGKTTEDNLNIVAGSYTVTITDANSCSTTISATVSEPAELTASILGTNVKCNGDNSGTVSVVASGGTPLYSYNWSNGSLQSSQANVTANTYLVTVTDANLCTVNKSLAITQPNALTTSIVSSNVNCYGEVSGSITLTVAGGVQDYSYIWNFGQTSSTLPDVQAGNYTVTVTDANLCTKTDSVIITQPNSALTSSLAVTNVSCNTGSDGAINLSVSGGTIPYTYNWALGSSDEDLIALFAGSYDLTVTDNKGCTTTNTAIVTQPNTISITEVISNVSCNGGNNGSINISVLGGTPSYSFLWSNGKTTQNISGLTSGNYTVTVTDSKLCAFSKTFNISNPSIIQIEVDSVNVNCNGDYNGSIDLTVTGGTPTYSYLWNNGITISDLSSLSGGTYKVTVTDKNGCLATEDVIIEEPNKLMVSTIITNVNCRGNATGKIKLLVTGGVITYNFAWNSGQTVDSIVNVFSGNYTCTVTDDNSCSTIVNATITQPAANLAIVPTRNNVSCFGGSDGSISLTITGGVLAYSYLWSNGVTTKNLTNITAGTYIITVTDANLCTATYSGIITEPTILASSIAKTNVSCFGESTGQANLTVTGGTANYTYTWSNGQTGLDDLNGVVAGKYIVTVVDAELCQIVDSVIITEPLAALQNIISGTNVSCYGGNDGTAQVSVSGGTAPYTYLWNYAQTTPVISNIVAGSYSVTVVDSLFCQQTSSINITEPTILSGNVVVSSVSCFGGTNGTANLTVSGGTSPYTFVWSNGATTEDLSNIPFGNYFVTITDAKNCTLVKTATISQPALLTANITGTNVDCNGNSTGKADLAITGGTAPHTYLWNNGKTTQDISTISAGNYTVTVTDGKSCMAIANVVITEPVAPLSLTYTSSNVKCYNVSTGTIDISVTGGTSPYTYLWGNGQLTEDLSNLSANTYSVIVTDSNSCIVNQSVIITQPANLTGSIVSSDIKCFGQNTGVLDLTVNGGVAPYIYSWNTTATTQDLNNVAAGNYTVTITDNNLCSKSYPKTLTQSDLLTATINPKHVDCYNKNTGEANLTVTGGTPIYSYVWSTGYLGQNLTNISDGSYDVTVTDANSCVTTASTIITEPTPIVLTTSKTNSTCNAADGSATVSASGGTPNPNYSYLWSNTKTTAANLNISSGIYTVSVTDSKNCLETATVAVNDEGAPVASISAFHDVSCNGKNDGWATVTATGGVGAYVYAWSTNVNTITASNLDGGIYYASVTDENHCVSIATATIQEPDVLLGSIIATNVKCKGNSTGSANLSVVGGTVPYTFAWSSGETSEDISSILAGNYSVIITDKNSCKDTNAVVVSEPAQVLSASATKIDAKCNGSKDGSIDLTTSGGTSPYSYIWNYGQLTDDISSISAGTYQVTVSDANSCKANTSITVNEPAALTSTIVLTNATCNNVNNGQADLTVLGGTSPYTYLWSNSAISEDLTNVLAGNYSVIITDSKLCTKTESAVISQPTGLAYSISGVNVKCFGESTGSIDLQVLGGTLPHSYSWNTGAISEDLSNIPAGNYSVNISDANSCTSTANITITQPAAVLSSTITGTNNSCFGNSLGTVDLTVSGGTSPYTYFWNYGQISEDLSNIPAGTYQVTVTDKNSCTTTNSRIISQPTEIILTPNQTASSCGNNDGTAQVSVAGGTSPYTYSWDGGSTNSSITNLSAKAYSVTVTDANNCTKQATINVSDNTAPTLSETHTNVSCFGASNGSIDLLVSAGTSPYTYLWSNTYMTDTLANLSGGNYTVTVTDANNCMVTKTINILEPTELTLSSILYHIDCKNDNDGLIDLMVTGGTTNYSYSWSNGSTSQDLNAIAGGTYVVTVTDANSCQKTLSNTLTEPATALSSTITSTNVSCNGLFDGTIDLSVSGGTPNYTFVWNNGTTTEDNVNLYAQNYEVTITDANGCISTNNATITEPNVLTSINSNSDVNCKNGNDGSAQINVSGGTIPYTYFWSNGDVDSLNQNLKAGNYLVTITDNNLCKLYSNATISEASTELAAVYQTVNLNCNGDNTGNINVLVNGGTSPYSYSWSNGATSKDLSNIPTGTYSLNILDDNNCPLTLSNISITEPTPISITGTVTNVKCFGENTGEINISVLGGNSSYQYKWNSGQINQDLSNVVAGNYTVTITDAKLCTKSENFTITESSQILTSVTKSNIKCYGANDGSIDLTVSGGEPPFAYHWNYGQTTDSIFGLPSGLYSVSIVDANNCLTQLSEVISEPQPMRLTLSKIDVNCNGASDGFVNLSVVGGTSPYTYSWSSGETTEDLSNIPAGIYTVIVTDANLCPETSTITVNEPTILVATNSQTNVSCYGGSTGAIDLSVSGATSPYTYLWNFGQTSQDISNLSAGNYSVTVTDFKNCKSISNISISEPATPLTINYTSEDAKCFGGATGKINLIVSGGTPNYTYKWNTGPITDNLTNIKAGTYQVTVIDSKSCQKIESISISEPSLLTGNISATAVKCKGENTGALDLTVSGGVSPYSYSWSNTGGSTTQDISNLFGGITYTVSIYDANNCPLVKSKLVSEPAAVLSANISSTAVKCYGESTGNVYLAVAGGTYPYTYFWNNGNTIEDLPNIPKGTYDVTVTDANACLITKTISVTEPTDISLIPTQTNSTCKKSDGFAMVTASGGAGGYSYKWSNGKTTPSISSIPAGVYTVTVTDANSCMDNISIAISDEGAPISNISALQNVTCNGKNDGFATVSATGGVGNYYYSWTSGANTATASNLDGGDYFVSVSDDNNCVSIAMATIQEPDVLSANTNSVNVKCKGASTGAVNLNVVGGTIPYSFVWSSGQTVEDISSVPAGFYSVTVTDKNACQTTSSATILEPAQVLTAITTKVDAKCFGNSDGSIDLTVTGGTPNSANIYSYFWNYGQTSQDLANLPAGLYEVTISDNYSCKTTASVIVNNPSSLNSNVVVTNATCKGNNDGAIDLIVTGGTQPYSYSWNNSTTGQDIANATAGNYFVIILDAQNCQIIQPATVTEPTILSYTISGIDVKCFGENTGSANLQVSGGTLPYVYSWNSGATTEDLNNLFAGTYSFTVTDSKLCQITASIVIDEPNIALNSSFVSANLSYYGSNDGTINLSVSDGTSPYTYLWSNGETTQDLANLSVGDYSVTITDNNNCKSYENITLSEPNDIVLSLIQNPSSCSGNTGNASVSAIGGNSPYTYLWSNNETNSSIQNLFAGTYSVTVTDANGGTKTGIIDVSDNTAQTISVENYVDVNCFGASNGSIDISILGGTAPYSYKWSNTNITEDILGLSGGNYSVSVTDANNCIATKTIFIDEPSEIQLSSTITDVDCRGKSNGKVELIVSGGTPIYSYNWSNTVTTSTNPNLSGGIYFVTVSDVNGCFKTLTNNVNEPSDSLKLSILSTKVSCFGLSDATVNLMVTGGTPNYTFQWSNGSTSEDLTNLSAGNYNVNVLDANSCPNSISVTVSQPQVLSLTNTFENVSCKYGADGKAKITVLGGTQPYTYFWNNGSILDSISNVKADIYTVEVTDSNQCKLNSTITISEPSKELSAIYSKTNVNCKGDSTGIINVTVSGGTQLYTYNWSNGSTTEDISNIPTGNYLLTITDENNCEFKLNNISISEPNQPLAISNINDNVKCFGEFTGSIDISVSGGTPNYQYSWNSGQINQDISNISAGNYTITVTDSKLCRTTKDITISEPTKLIASISKTNVSCYGFSDGSATLTLSGATSPYTFNWNYGQKTQDISAVSAGFYSVSIVDDNKCLTTLSEVINEPQPLALSFVKTNVNCKSGSDASVNITVNGGTPNYSYLWNSGETNEDLSNIPVGNYQVTVTDRNSCEIISSIITVIEPVLALDASIVGTNVTCNGKGDGSANLTVIGGTGTYMYHWNYGNNIQDIVDLLAGVYEVTVTDVNNCTDTSSVEITQPNSIVILSTKTNSTCGKSDGTASVTVSGGTTPYSYIWSTGETSNSISGKPAGTYIVTVSDAHSCSNFAVVNINDFNGPISEISNSTEPTCFGYNDGTASVVAIGGIGTYTYEWSNAITQATTTGLSAGVYSVTVSDVNNCKSSSSVILQQPEQIQITSIVEDASCHGSSDASINLTVIGGTPNYFYEWSNGKTSQDLTAIKAGNYEITVSDKNNCQATELIVVNEPNQDIIITEISHTNVSCFGMSNGALDISVSGGTPNYQYLWNNGKTSQDLVDLSAGNYELTVTDSKSCTGIFTVQVSQPNEIISNAVVQNISCFGANDGEIAVTITGGNIPYNLNWNNGSASEDLLNLSKGNYSLVITDNKNCKDTLKANITEPEILATHINKTDVKCFGGNDGVADLIVTGGNQPYNYSWSENAQTTEDISDLIAGNYSVTVIDLNNCSSISNVTISEPSQALAISFEKFDAKCYNSTDGSINLNITGGTPNYTYTWGFGQTSQDIANLNANTYNVIVSDANNCTETESITISQPSIISIVPNPKKSACNSNTGIATATISGGTGNYTYLWSTGETSDSLKNVSAGAYTLTVTDENACEMVKTINVNDLGMPELIVSHNDVKCFGDANAWIDILLTAGGNPPFTFNWNNGANSDSITGLSGGTYFVTVTDFTGCKSFADQFIDEKPKLESQISATNVNCNGGNDGMVYLTVTGGMRIGFYSYNWSNSEITEDLDNVVADLYSVTISDSKGCQIFNNIEVTEPNNPLSITHSETDVSCYNFNDGAINITVAGGTEPYVYLWNYGQTSQDLKDLSAGIYELSVTDAKKCSTSVVIEIEPKQPLSITSNITHVNCKNETTGAINLSVSGGTVASNYQYFWETGQTTANLTNLSAGLYFVTVKDDNNCEISKSVQISGPVASLVSQISGTPVSCNGFTDGTASIQVFGGTPNYNILWSNSKNDYTINNLSVGTYSVQIIDDNGCKSNQQFTVSEPQNLTVSETLDSVRCFGNSDGNINLSVLGGTKPYMYEWNNGDVTQDLNNIKAGNYFVTVTDANECKVETNYKISQPTQILVSSPIPHHVSCNGLSDGSLELSVSGGVSSYSFAWNYGHNTEDLLNIAAGNYMVTITDHNKCFAFQSAIINQPDPITIDETIVDVSCFGLSDGNIDITVSGGTPNPGYDYDWSNGSSAQDVSDLKIGTFTVTVTDGNNCQTNSTFTITQPSTINISVVSSISASFDGTCDGYLQLSSSGGTPNYIYDWTGGLNGSTQSTLCQGDYTVTVTDSKGCKDSLGFYVDKFPPDAIADFVIPDPDCPPLEVQFENTSQFGVSYLWDFGDGTTSTDSIPYHVFTKPGIYIVELTVVGPSGKEDSKKAVVRVYPIPGAKFKFDPKVITTFDKPVYCTNLSSYEAVSYSWDFGDGATSNEENPSHTYDVEGIYDISLIAITEYGCKDTFIVENAVDVKLNCEMIFPNAFIPNKTGANGGVWDETDILNNSVFHPKSRKIEKYKLEIFTRWGELIFVSEDVNIGWDGYYNGKLCQQDVYVFKAVYKCFEDNSEIPIVGDVTLYH